MSRVNYLTAGELSDMNVTHERRDELDYYQCDLLRGGWLYRGDGGDGQHGDLQPLVRGWKHPPL